MSEDEILLTHALQCRPIDLAVNKPVLTDFQKKQFEECKRRRAAGEPLQYILGSWDFMGLKISVDPSVLVPRPETEQMVEQAVSICHSRPRLKHSGVNSSGNPFYILDLGTGSGCIAIALAKFCPEAHVTAVDISAQALKVARENARMHGVGGRIDFIQADIKLGTAPNFWFKSLEKELGAVPNFDLIISNPPYIPSSQMAHLPADVRQEPALALDGGPDGLDFYRAIIKSTPRLLKREGCLMMEFGDGQEKAIQALFGRGFQVVIHPDLTGKERFLTARSV